MTRVLIAFISAVLSTAFASIAVGQTDDELRAIYFRRDFGRMEEIARTGDVRAEAWMGLIKQQAGHRREAKEWWRRAAEKNNRWAITSLAEMHRWDGEAEGALYWYRRGAENGNPENQVTLAWFLLEGTWGFPLDPWEAFRWYAAAASQRYHYAYLPVAELKAAGIGTERNRVEAYAFAELAETVRRDSSDHSIERIKALKERLAQDLEPAEIVQAARLAREIRPDLDEIRARQQRDELLFPFVMMAFFAAFILFLLALGWLIWRFVTWGLRAPKPAS